MKCCRDWEIDDMMLKKYCNFRKEIDKNSEAHKWGWDFECTAPDGHCPYQHDFEEVE